MAKGEVSRFPNSVSKHELPFLDVSFAVVDDPNKSLRYELERFIC